MDRALTMAQGRLYLDYLFELSRRPSEAGIILNHLMRKWTLCSPPGSSVHGILQGFCPWDSVRGILLEWVAISSSRESS